MHFVFGQYVIISKEKVVSQNREGSTFEPLGSNG